MTMKKFKIPAIGLFVTILLFGHLGFFSPFTSNTIHSKPSQDDVFSEAHCNQSFAKVYLDLGNLAVKRADLCSAIKCYKNALEHKYDYLQAYDALGKTHELLGNKKEAFDVYFKAMSINPNFIESRFYGEIPVKITDSNRFTLLKDKIPWQGEDLLDKTIFVYAEKGLGDTLQFCRFLPILIDKGAKVLFKPQAPLSSLLKKADLKADIIEATIDPATLSFDYYASLLSLPHILKTSFESIPRPDGYLVPDRKKIKEFKQKLAAPKKQKIGICWQGDPNHINDKNRSIPLSFFYQIAQLENVQIYSLQKGFGSEQLENIPGTVNIINLEHLLTSFEYTAAAICNLDLVISVDSAVAHLAGALGKPVWILLPKITDWRWLGFTKDQTTCWYDSMVKKQQHEAGNWTKVFDEIIKQLSQK